MLAEEYAARKPQLETFAAGHAQYYAGSFVEAERIFGSVAAADPAAESYAKKCRLLAAAPPEAEWNGVWVMTEK
jgi:adenylate cyclase